MALPRPSVRGGGSTSINCWGPAGGPRAAQGCRDTERIPGVQRGMEQGWQGRAPQAELFLACEHRFIVIEPPQEGEGIRSSPQARLLSHGGSAPPRISGVGC